MQQQSRSLPVLKEIQSASSIAWAPSSYDKTILAAGNVQGMLDENFQTSAKLELYSADLSAPGKDPFFLGSVAVTQCNFSKIAWGSKGTQDSSHSMGIIAGGMSNGALHLWDAAKITEDPQKALLGKFDKHRGPILGLDFNHVHPNLLATSSADGEVLVWDLANMSAPTASKPTADGQSMSRFGVSAVAWNSQVPHIFASSTSNGETYVWDLRQKRSIINFTDSSRSHTPATSLAWDPLQPRQLIVTYANSTPEIWDLKNSLSPKTVLQYGHSKGVLSVHWNPHDPRFLCTSGDDCLTSFWTSEGELMHQIEHEGVPFEFEWNPQGSSMFATSLYNGKIQVKNVNYVGQRVVPNWLGEKVGCGFGFGGKVASFESLSARVRMSRSVSESEFVGLFRSFQNLLQVKSADQICDEKIHALAQTDSEDAKTWKYIRELFSANPNNAFRDMLGFANTGVGSLEKEGNMNAEQFFDTFGADSKTDSKTRTASLSPQRQRESDRKKSSSAVHEEDNDVDKRIKHYLLIGNYPNAVDECFKSNRLADALLLSSLGGPDLWSASQQRYVQNYSRPYVKNLINAVVSHNFETMISETKSDEWNETLSFLITYAKEHEFETLVNKLGAKLFSSGLRLPAVICSLLSGNMDLAMKVWMSNDSTDVGAVKLHRAVEKLYVVTQAFRSHERRLNSSVSQYFSEYAGLLASQGYLDDALRFMDLISSEVGETELSQRIKYAVSGYASPVVNNVPHRKLSGANDPTRVGRDPRRALHAAPRVARPLSGGESPLISRARVPHPSFGVRGAPSIPTETTESARPIAPIASTEPRRMPPSIRRGPPAPRGMPMPIRNPTMAQPSHAPLSSGPTAARVATPVPVARGPVRQPLGMNAVRATPSPPVPGVPAAVANPAAAGPGVMRGPVHMSQPGVARGLPMRGPPIRRAAPFPSSQMPASDVKPAPAHVADPTQFSRPGYPSQSTPSQPAVQLFPHATDPTQFSRPGVTPLPIQQPQHQPHAQPPMAFRPNPGQSFGQAVPQVTDSQPPRPGMPFHPSQQLSSQPSVAFRQIPSTAGPAHASPVMRLPPQHQASSAMHPAPLPQPTYPATSQQPQHVSSPSLPQQATAPIVSQPSTVGSASSAPFASRPAGSGAVPQRVVAGHPRTAPFRGPPGRQIPSSGVAPTTTSQPVPLRPLEPQTPSSARTGSAFTQSQTFVPSAAQGAVQTTSALTQEVSAFTPSSSHLPAVSSSSSMVHPVQQSAAQSDFSSTEHVHDVVESTQPPVDLSSTFTPTEEVQHANRLSTSDFDSQEEIKASAPSPSRSFRPSIQGRPMTSRPMTHQPLPSQSQQPPIPQPTPTISSAPVLEETEPVSASAPEQPSSDPSVSRTLPPRTFSRPGAPRQFPARLPRRISLGGAPRSTE